MTIEHVAGSVTEQTRKSKFVIIPHCCNDIGVMGAGIAKHLYLKWPSVKYEYLKMKIKLGNVGFVLVDDNTIIANMIAQHGIMSPTNKKPIRYDSLKKCIEKVRVLSIKINAEIHAPKFGSGLAGGDWDVIEEMINDIWNDIRVVICTIN